MNSSSTLLYNDLQRQSAGGIEFGMEVALPVGGKTLIAPILAETTRGQKFIIALSGPLTPDYPSDPKFSDLQVRGGGVSLIVGNELLVRKNLPAAGQSPMKPQPRICTRRQAIGEIHGIAHLVRRDERRCPTFGL